MPVYEYIFSKHHDQRCVTNDSSCDITTESEAGKSTLICSMPKSRWKIGVALIKAKLLWTDRAVFKRWTNFNVQIFTDLNAESLHPKLVTGLGYNTGYFRKGAAFEGIIFRCCEYISRDVGRGKNHQPPSHWATKISVCQIGWRWPIFHLNFMMLVVIILWLSVYASCYIWNICPCMCNSIKWIILSEINIYRITYISSYM